MPMTREQAVAYLSRSGKYPSSRSPMATYGGTSYSDLMRAGMPPASSSYAPAIAAALSNGLAATGGVSGLGAFLSGGGGATSAIAGNAAATAPVAASALPASGAGASALTSMGMALPVAAAIGLGALGTYQGVKGLENVARNKPMNFGQNLALAFPSGGLSLLYNPMRKMFGVGKAGKETQARKSDLDSLADRGVLNNGQWTNAAGKTLSAFADPRENYNVDFSKAGIGDTVALANPLAAVLSQGGAKQRSDLAGQITNAIYGSNSQNDLKKLYSDAKIDYNTAWNKIDEMQKSGALGQQEGDVYKGTLTRFFGKG